VGGEKMVRGEVGGSGGGLGGRVRVLGGGEGG